MRRYRTFSGMGRVLSMTRPLILFSIILAANRAWPAGDEMRISAPISYSGMCDASAGVALDAQCFAVANDEDNVIRIYPRDRSSGPLQSLDLSAFLEVDPRKPESDLEAAARMGDRIYWMTSLGRNKSGKERFSRYRFFATDIKATRPRAELAPVGKPYKFLLLDLLNDPKLRDFHLDAAARLTPKSKGALNIEGICSTPEQHLLIGFRNPIPKGKALLVPLLNPAEVIEGRPARLGEARQLDLGGLGIRDLAFADGQYLIIAGAYSGHHHSKLYRWDGGLNPPQPIHVKGLAEINPEALILYPDKGLKEFQLLSDDGTRPVNGVPCKALLDPNLKAFRSLWVTMKEGR